MAEQPGDGTPVIAEPSRTTPVYGEFDAVAVGGGPAGIMAASPAARTGHSTILLKLGGIVIVRGSLAPDGAVVKRTVADDGLHQFTGPAKVFRSREEGLAAIRGGEVRPGQVLVLTGLGLRGPPGMGLTSVFVFALDGAGLSGKVAVITDGQLPGLVNKGLSVAEASPEGAAGGPLGLVENGDPISVGTEARTIELEVPEPELARRRAQLSPLTPPAGCGWLSVYARSASPSGRARPSAPPRRKARGFRRRR